MKMGKKSGKKGSKKGAKTTPKAEKWNDEGNDDESFASHSRRSIDAADQDDLVYSVSRSRSISFTAEPKTDEEDLADSHLSDDLNGLMARGSPTLSQSSLVASPYEEPYCDSLSARSSQRQRTFDIIQFSDGEDDDRSVELDGLLLEEIEPFEKNKRRSSWCFRITLLLAVAGVIGLVTTFSVIEYQKRATQNLRGNGSSAHSSPSAESLFGTHSSMTNTHGLDVNAGEIGQSSMTNTHGLDMNDAEINNCVDNLNCKWVAEATAQRCANERVLSNCRATCDPSCGGTGWSHLNEDDDHEDDDNFYYYDDDDDDDDEDDEDMTEFPTEFPTLLPTYAESSWDSEDMTSWDTEDMTAEFSAELTKNPNSD